MEVKKLANIKFWLGKIDKKQFCNSLEGQKSIIYTSLYQVKIVPKRGENSNTSVKIVNKCAKKLQ